jgi:hypothetical protein
LAGKSRDSGAEGLKQVNRELRSALDECRELLAKTEKLLKRADRTGGTVAD